MDNTPQHIVIDNTADGKASVKLYARDGASSFPRSRVGMHTVLPIWYGFPRGSMGTRKQGKVSS